MLFPIVSGQMKLGDCFPFEEQVGGEQGEAWNVLVEGCGCGLRPLCFYAKVRWKELKWRVAEGLSIAM